MEGRCIVYVDETTVHRWQLPRFIWSKKDMSFQMPESRGVSFTIIGAISKEHGLLHFEIIKGSNNQVTFGSFVDALLLKCPECTVVMDNLSVHKAHSVRQRFTHLKR